MRTHERSLFGQAHLLCGHYQEAQDLVQEAFARAWQQWAVVSLYEDPRAWVRRVLHNLAVSRWRRTRYAVARSTADAARHTAGPDAGHLDIAGAISRLPARQRVALVLYAIDDLTVPEVASEMGVPEGSVRGWLTRARATLAADLGMELELQRDRRSAR